MVVQSPCVGTSNQQLRIDYLEGSSYDTVVGLKFAHSAKCASPSGGSTTQGATVVQRTCTAEASQQWVLRAGFNPAQPEGRYRIQGVNDPAQPPDLDLALDVRECLPDGEVRMWRWLTESPCQRWQFEPLGDDIYRIVEPSTGEALDVPGCTDDVLQRVATSPKSDHPCQRWRVEPAHGGSWSITRNATVRRSTSRSAPASRVPA